MKHISSYKHLPEKTLNIQDTEVLKKAMMQSVHTILKLAQLSWTGHVTRVRDERLPKKVLHAELQEGKRSQGSQKKRYKETKDSIIQQSGVYSLENEQLSISQREYMKLKEGVKTQNKIRGIIIRVVTVGVHSSTCNRQFKAKIGLSKD